ATGTMASAAEKKTTGGGIPPMCSSTTVMGMKASSQWTEGFIESDLLRRRHYESGSVHYGISRRGSVSEERCGPEALAAPLRWRRDQGAGAWPVAGNYPRLEIPAWKYQPNRPVACSIPSS